MNGTLYVVSTPIGNLSDITFRAVDTLKAVDLIACEDTRHTRILLDRYDIRTPTTSYFQHNQIKKAPHLIKQLKEGKDIALVCDAGTPGISDPGAHIIKLAIDNHINIVAIPGAAAFVTALVLSGKPTHKFIFEGFLSNKSGARKKRLRELSGEKRTIILYESPHRIQKTLKDILDIFGDKEIAVMRELTKKFEEVRREKTSKLITHFENTRPRGEFIIII